MSITLVGAAGTLSEVAAASITPAFGQATTAGNLLVGVVSSEGALSAITTTASGWSRAINQTGQSGEAAIFYKQNCATGETAPTFTSTGSTFMAASLAEFSGADTSAPLDQTGGQNSDATSPITTTAAAADANADDLAICVTALVNSKTATYTFSRSWTPAGGTSGVLGHDGATKQINHHSGDYYLLSGNGGGAADSLALTVTPSTGSINQTQSCVASFKAAASGPSLTTVTGVGQIATASAFGTSDVQFVAAPAGVASSQAFGVAKLITTILKAIGIATTETFGTTRVLRVVAAAGAVASLEAFGTPTKSPQVVFEHPGITSQETFGQTSRLRFLVKPVALTSAETFGTAKLIRILRNAGAITSSQAFGTASLIRVVGNAGAVSTTEAFGLPTLAAAGGTLQTISAAGGIPRPTILVPIAG